MSSLSKEIKCLICDKNFLTKKGLEIHEREQTCINKVDSYICMICGLDCKQKSNYDRHINRKKKCEPIKKEENNETITNESITNETTTNETTTNETTTNETTINEKEELKKEIEKIKKENEELKREIENLKKIEKEYEELKIRYRSLFMKKIPRKKEQDHN